MYIIVSMVNIYKYHLAGGKMVFIKFEDITNEVTIDCRTVEEF